MHDEPACLVTTSPTERQILLGFSKIFTAEMRRPLLPRGDHPRVLRQRDLHRNKPKPATRWRLPKRSGRTCGTTCRAMGTTPPSNPFKWARAVRNKQTSVRASGAHREVSNDGRMAHGGEIHGACHVSTCTCSGQRRPWAVWCIESGQNSHQRPLWRSSEGVRGQRRHGNPRHHANA